MTNKKFVVVLLSFAIFSFCMAPQVAHAIPVDLTAGTWQVQGVDLGGNNWGGSTLVFETQAPVGPDFSLTGHFNWIGSGGQFGRENFTGTLFSNQALQLFGFQIVPPASGIVTASYFATLAASGNDIINGSWSGAAIIPSNNWSASRASVPEPSTVWLFGAGLLGLGAALANRKPA